MSPLKRKKLLKIRVELDKLDNSLIKIIKKRTNLVKKVLSLKDKKNQIVDQKRIKTILKNIRKKSIKNKIDTKVTNKIWKNMISAYIDFERRNLMMFEEKLFVIDFQDLNMGPIGIDQLQLCMSILMNIRRP